jgi:hypothetical protein
LKDDENHSRGGFNFHPVFNPLNQLLGAVLDFGFWILDCGWVVSLGADLKSKF